MSKKQSKKKNHHSHTPESVDTHKESDKKDSLRLDLIEQLGKKDPLDEILAHYTAWLPRYQEFAQGRSDFQIEKMIATEHATPAASYQHTLYQLRVLHQSLIGDFVQGIEQKRTFEYKWSSADKEKPQWWEQGKGGKKLCWYDTDRIQHEHRLEELKMSVTDKLLQLKTFTKVLEAMEDRHNGPFTQTDLNDEEPEYWRLRLARQMGDEYLDRQTGLGTGSLKSLRMAVADSPVPGSKNKVEDFPDLLNAVLSGRESGLDALNAVNEELFGYMNNLGAKKTSLPNIQNTTEKVTSPESETKKPQEKPTTKEIPQPGTTEQQQAEALNRLNRAGVGINELED